MGKHIGDCTCVPCSCSKCIAENMFGIDTIPKVGKHSLYKIDNAFGKDNERTIDEAIESLAKYNPTRSADYPEDTWNACMPRWIEEAKQAHAWLVSYRDRHFPGEQPQITEVTLGTSTEIA